MRGVRILCLLHLFAVATVYPAAAQQSPPLELSRPVRPWEFLPTVGRRAALLGNEAGILEAWVYPLKVFRDFHLQFLTDGEVIPAAALARTVIVRPESATIIYSADTFSVHETLFVPVDEPGAVILIDVQTSTPLEIEAGFRRDFQLEWPGSLGGTYLDWDYRMQAFYFGEGEERFAAYLGSPTGREPRLEYETNFFSSEENSLRLGTTTKGRETKVIVLAASVNGRSDAARVYRRISEGYSNLLQQAADYYRNSLASTVQLALPDQQIQEAYDWARVSVLQGFVTNPFLGTGLVAGYRTSGDDERPGFAWFFGRDALWTSLALDSEGDFPSARTALDFLAKYQRDDGKVPHEVSQSATLVPWFKDYPFPYSSADATPLFIIALDRYVRASGDIAFASDKWDNAWRAYLFLKSTENNQGLAQNSRVGHGWIEGGPLLPVKTEIYQSGLGVEALSSLSDLAGMLGKHDISTMLAQLFVREERELNQTFWSPDKATFAYALDTVDRPIDQTSVLAAVPMWFGLLDSDRTAEMLSEFAGPTMQTDWGMRIIPSNSPMYSGGGYHFGSVWPLFTGWAAVGEYRYHRALAGYLNLRANALLTRDGSLGHVTEALSGDYYGPLSTSSAHQIWSAAMIVSPLLRGLFGLDVDAVHRTVVFSPHVPADWDSFSIKNLRVGSAVLELDYRNDWKAIALDVKCSGDCTGSSQDGRNGGIVFDFRPALCPRAHVGSATLNGRRVPHRVFVTDETLPRSGSAGASTETAGTDPSDEHVESEFTITGSAVTFRLRYAHDFGVSVSSALPPLGGESRSVRIISQSWSPALDAMTLEVAGVSGSEYSLGIWNADEVQSVEGGRFVETGPGRGIVQGRFPAGKASEYQRTRVRFYFSTKHR